MERRIRKNEVNPTFVNKDPHPAHDALSRWRTLRTCYALARVFPFTHNDKCVCMYVRRFLPSTASARCLTLFLFAFNETFRAPPTCLEPFTSCWVSHRNLLRPHFHPRGSRRRENPSDLLVVQEESP